MSIRSLLLIALVLGACDQPVGANVSADASPVAERPSPLIGLADADPAQQLGAIERIDREWQPRYVPALLEYISLGIVPALQHRAMEVLRKRTSEDFGYDLNAWFAWVWRQDFEHLGDYADFKSSLYRIIDPRFGGYFAADRESAIRLDEVRWGGVRQDGIPPLRQPNMIAGRDATYLADGDVVFGIEVGGTAYAYPKRILAWHEMFVDTLGGVPLAGVYCTLCGSMILYETTANGVQHELGTSGFLYRSNKLMYDKETQSLWNTLWGTPAIGPLVGESIRLKRRSVVTTTWAEWRRRHPDTQVLSLDTGFNRDYGEGVAYRDYFSDDELMFNTSQVDHRLANKAEVLGLVFPEEDAPPLAVAAEYARKHPLIHERVGTREFVILTDRSGAMRAYRADDVRFVAWDGDREVVDEQGRTWTLSEERLAAGDEVRQRLPSHSAFWFGWYGAYSNTRLLHEASGSSPEV